MGVFCRLFKLLLLHWGIRRFGASEAAYGGAPPKTGAAGLPLLGGSVSLWRASRVMAARRGIPELAPVRECPTTLAAGSLAILSG